MPEIELLRALVANFRGRLDRLRSEERGSQIAEYAVILGIAVAGVAIVAGIVMVIGRMMAALDRATPG